MAQPEFIKQLVAFDRREVYWIISSRCTAGLGACVLVYTLAGHPSWGVLASLGALYAGLASYTGIFQTRLRHMLATATVITLQAIVGTLVGGNDWATLASVTLVAVLFSLYAALRPAANLLATYAMACTVIFSKVLPVHTDVARAAMGNGLIVLSGAGFQMLALSVLWPFTRFHPERRAVARVYESLADFARLLAGTQEVEMMKSRSIQDAHETLDPIARYHAHPEQVALRRALSAAEGIRATMVALTGIPSQDRLALSEWLQELASRLHTIATAIKAGHLLELKDAAAPPVPASLQQSAGALVHVIEELLKRLSARAEPASPTEARADWRSHLSFRLIALENSRTLRWMAIQHAARMGAAMLAATCLGRFGGIHYGYWIPLTTCLVLRTDYATTLSRGFARASGAVAGVLLSIAIAAVVHQSVPIHTAIFMLASFGIFAVYRASYFAYSIMITLWVVSSLAAAGVPQRVAGWYRLEDTVIGAAIAFAAYRLLPTWQSTRVSEILCDAASAQATFCERVLLIPSMPPRAAWERELDATRAIRYEAEAVVTAATKEPAWDRRLSGTPVEETLLELERNAARILGVLAQRLVSPDLTPELAAQASKAQTAANQLASDLCRMDSAPAS